MKNELNHWVVFDYDKLWSDSADVVRIILCDKLPLWSCELYVDWHLSDWRAFDIIVHKCKILNHFFETKTTNRLFIFVHHLPRKIIIHPQNNFPHQISWHLCQNNFPHQISWHMCVCVFILQNQSHMTYKLYYLTTNLKLKMVWKFGTNYV